MNDLGMTFVWSAFQITLILVPAAVLHALASRRSPGTGSRIATLGLALSLVIATATLIPRTQRNDELLAATSMPVDVAPNAALAYTGKNLGVSALGDASLASDTGPLGGGISLTLAGFLRVWRRLEPGPMLPAARFRQWGGALALAAIAGAGIGLLRLLVGLWAIRLCRRRATIVNDPVLIGLRDALQVAMGCRQRVEIREAPDLTAPATAGWRRPVILLPDDWRSWNDVDRRAVLAHELAHIHRWDYAAGLVAQLALALEFYHPLVHWMARRLQLQQELAADAEGARFTGGRESYLLSLSRLALRQDERTPNWPARAFLPARGTLIRRIAMLQNNAVTTDRQWSRSLRLLAGVCLFAIAIGVIMLRGPARADEKGKRPETPTAPNQTSPRADLAGATPFDVTYLSEKSKGMFALRPAATVRRARAPHVLAILLADFDVFPTVLLADFARDFPTLAKKVGIDPPAPGALELRLNQIDWIIGDLSFDRGGKGPGGQEMRRVLLAGPTLRTLQPFDWLTFLRGWRFELTEVSADGRTYFRVGGNMKRQLGRKSPCVYLPDARTIVFKEEQELREMLTRTKPVVPAYLAGADWERFSHGLLAIAINNRDGKFAKSYDLDRPDDALVLSLFKGVDHWIFGVDDADAIGLHALAVCRADAGESIAGSVESLVKMGQVALARPEKVGTPSNDFERADRMASSILKNIRVTHDEHSVNVRSDGFGTLAEWGSIMTGVTKAQAEDAGVPFP
jgi:beta-lactamase regulating signal transducer with metallopeptidase domain